MSEREATTGGDGEAAPDGDGGRNLGQAVVAAIVVVGLLSAAAMLPAQGTQGGGGGGGGSGNGPAGPGGSGGGGGSIPGGDALGGLGALNPGSQTDVGGALQSAGDVGGSLSRLSNSVHFTVRSDSPAYWRTGAYGLYTGDGWEQSQRAPWGGAGTDGHTVVQRVRLERSARSLPAAWKPRSVEILNATSAAVRRTERGAYRVDRPVPAGTTYRAVSRVGAPDPRELRTAGTGYPDDVARYYTQLPASSTDRLAEFAGELTRNASNPYETARMVELWLENAKGYSLNASHDTSKPVVDQFVFEMEAGYCEYFATAMAAMLRTQGVPARYVVGYAPGRESGSETYTVRGTDAHAWVEVYFPDEGWVRFDPTPAASRRAEERRNRSAAEVERRPIVEGSPGDGGGVDLPPIPGDGVNGSPEVPGVAPDRTPSPPYQVKLLETPVPGKAVTARVTKGGKPIEGVVVTFDGEAVGRTDRNGEVTAEVPYVSALTVGARLPEGVDGGDDDTVFADREPRAVDSSGPTLSMGAGPTETVAGGHSSTQFGSADGNDSERTYDVSTDVALTVNGTLAPGRSVVLTATIGGVPVRDARVTVDGEAIGRTDASGRVGLDVAESARGTLAVTVERGSVTDRTTLPVARMGIGLAPDTVLALPGQGATVRVTVGDAPVPNAPVTVDGERVGTTDAEGRIHVTLPTDGDVRIGAEGPVLSRTVTVSGLFLNAAVAILGVIGVVAGLVVGVRRHGPDAESGAATARGVLEGLAAWAVAVPGRLADRAVDAAIVVGRYLDAALSGAIRAAETVAARVAGVSYTALAVAAVSLVGRTLAGVARWVLAVPGRVVGLIVGSSAGGESGTTGDVRHTADGTDVEGGGDGGLSVRAAWRLFVRTLGLARPETMTPGEIRRLAVDRGFPERPVSRLTDAFRDVEYGGREPTDRLRDRARDAIRRVREDDERRRRERAPRGDD
jgi:transglutaminase-like putative cysteine protease